MPPQDSSVNKPAVQGPSSLWAVPSWAGVPGCYEQAGWVSQAEQAWKQCSSMTPCFSSCPDTPPKTEWYLDVQMKQTFPLPKLFFGHGILS